MSQWDKYTDDQLVDMAKELHHITQVEQCCSTDEQLEYHNVIATLKNRGYVIASGLNIYKEVGK